MKTKFIFLLTIMFAFLNLALKEPANEYKLDAGHTYIGFDVERFLVGEVTGRFNEFTGNISMSGNDYTSLEIQATINTKSLDTNNETRDGHLKGEMWLHTEKFPEIVFKSSGVRKKGKEHIMDGQLTIHGVTKAIEFPVSIMGPFKDPTKQTAIGLKADLIIDRFDYDIKFNKKMDNGSFFIGNEVKVKLRALAYKK